MVDEITVGDVERQFGFLLDLGATLSERYVGKEFAGGAYGGFQLIYRHHEMDVRISYGRREFIVEVSLPGSNDWWPVVNLGTPRSGWPDTISRECEYAEFERNFLRDHWPELVRRLRVYKPGFVPPPI